MTNTKTDDVSATLAQIRELAVAGCDIVRVAVPDIKAAEAISKLKMESPLPIVADIHFDHKLALEAIANGVDALRINPGNIGGEANVKEVAISARNAGIPIRVGVNSGSIEPTLKLGTPLALCTNAHPRVSLYTLGVRLHNLPKFRGRSEAKVSADDMVTAAMEHIKILNRHDFDDIVVSLKSSDVRTTIESYRRMREVSDYPLHLGVTEAGIEMPAAVKSALGIGALLLEGIGDTIRVSVTGDVVKEVEIAEEILVACGMGRGIEVISCPTCGRCAVDLIPIAEEIYKRTRGIRKKMVVAVMGCAVNGPGEARHADLGVACGDGNAVLFKKGEIVRTIDEREIVEVLMKEIGGA
jgi:(E)-4-hydroxy-3-methylbut-2-enyl-diphosphate synthase